MDGSGEAVAGVREDWEVEYYIKYNILLEVKYFKLLWNCILIMQMGPSQWLGIPAFLEIKLYFLVWAH